MSDELLDRLKTADPAPGPRVDRELRELGDVPARIASEPVVVPFHRRPNVRRAAIGIAAAIVALGLILPLALLRPLGGDGRPGDDGPTPTGPVGTVEWITVGPLSVLQAEGVTYVAEEASFVVASEGEPFALFAFPPGVEDDVSGVRVLYCGGMFQGSNGAMYSLGGVREDGSGTEPLFRVATRTLDGSVQIDPTTLTTDTDAASSTFRSGPPCQTSGGVPLEGEPGFGIAADAGLPPIAVALPQRGMLVSSPVHIVGSADVFEATVSIRIRDAVNNVIAESFTTATCGTGCRGDFDALVDFEVGQEQQGVIEVFESSAKDGSPINVVEIPVTLVPTPGATAADAFEGPWTAPDGSQVQSDPGKGTEIAVFEGPDHCGWTSMTFMHLGWPVGTVEDVADDERQYLRDPQGLFADRVAAPFDPDAELPSDAVNTGYHRGPVELWISPSDEDEAVYVVNLDTDVVERWTRPSLQIGCD